MTKRELIGEMVARRKNLAHREAEGIINAMFETMADALERGERIEIRGFGSFAVKRRDARQGRNPRTGATLAVESKRIPFFRVGKDLRLELNGVAQEDSAPEH